MTPVAETLLFCASRAQLAKEKVLPALTAGKVVLCDRFLDSTTVYQGHGRGLSIPSIQTIHEFSVGRCRPDLTLALMMEPDASVKRARKSSNRYDRMEAQKKAFYRSIYVGYRALCRNEPARIKWIEADRSRSAVHDDIWMHVSRRLARP